jgi:hypothetical protein
VTTDPIESREAAAEEPPPVLSRWRNVYVVVLVELALIVALFWALTRWAS